MPVGEVFSGTSQAWGNEKLADLLTNGVPLLVTGDEGYRGIFAVAPLLPWRPAQARQSARRRYLQQTPP